MAVIDSYGVSNFEWNNPQSDIMTSGGTGTVGQSFTGNGQTLGYVQILIQAVKLYEGFVFGSSFVNIYAHSGVYGTSSLPTGVALATSNAVDSTSFLRNFSLVTFTFSGVNQITLTNATNYVLGLDRPSITSPSQIRVGWDSTSPTHGGNAYDGSPNFAIATSDLIFYVYDTAGGPPTTMGVLKPNALRPHPFSPGLAR